MGGLITAKDIAWAVENCPPQLVAVCVIVLLVAWLTIKVDRVVTAGLKRIDDLAAENKMLKKQQHKLIQLISAAPCVSKANGIWLGDEGRNGGQSPEPIMCRFEQSKRES